MPHKPAPRIGFVLTLVKVTGRGRSRWRNEDGSRLYEWDELHGEFEVYNRRGRHLGVVDQHGKLTKEAVEGRYINV